MYFLCLGTKVPPPWFLCWDICPSRRLPKIGFCDPWSQKWRNSIDGPFGCGPVSLHYWACAWGILSTEYSTVATKTARAPPSPPHNQSFPEQLALHNRNTLVANLFIDQRSINQWEGVLRYIVWWGQTWFSHFASVHSEDPMKIVSISDGDWKSAHNYTKNMWQSDHRFENPQLYSNPIDQIKLSWILFVFRLNIRALKPSHDFNPHNNF